MFTDFADGNHWHFICRIHLANACPQDTSMTFRRSALSFLLALYLAPGAALAQDRTASAVAFGGTSMNTFSASAPKIDFGVNVGKELTPNIQAIGEFGRVGDMLPTLSAGLLSAGDAV
jgi:hypothetical protein